MGPALTEAQRIDVPIEAYLRATGDVFQHFPHQDSGNLAYGIAIGGDRFFVKVARGDILVRRLQNGIDLNRAFTHPVLPRLLNSFAFADGLAAVYQWVDGVTLSAAYPDKNDPRKKAGLRRFCTLPADRRLAAVNTILDLHLRLAKAGYIAVDFYSGCLIYEFDRHRLHVFDLDHYRRGAFVLEKARLPGSTSYMAPEEFVRGATIDQCTNAFTLGRAALILNGGWYR